MGILSEALGVTADEIMAEIDRQKRIVAPPGVWPICIANLDKKIDVLIERIQELEKRPDFTKGYHDVEEFYEEGETTDLKSAEDCVVEVARCGCCNDPIETRKMGGMDGTGQIFCTTCWDNRTTRQ